MTAPALPVSSSRTPTETGRVVAHEPLALTLVQSNAAPLDPSADRAREVLEAHGLRLGARRALAPHAVDLVFEGTAEEPLADLEERVREAVGEPVDLALQPRVGRRKRLLIADMESTVIREEMLEELAARLGLRERVTEITTRAMNGELDFREAMAERVGLLEGMGVDVLDECAADIHVDPGAAALVATLRAHGAHTALVSGGFLHFARPIARRLGFDEVHANRLEQSGGRLLGRVAEPLLDRGAKLRLLESMAEEHGLSPADAVAVGDGANDLAMLGAAGLGVAYHGKPAVAAAARFRIDHGDLSTLLYFQGYTRAEWTV